MSGKQLRPSAQSSKLVQTFKKEARPWRKLRNNRHVYSIERTKQRNQLNEEISCLNKLREQGAISEDIYARYMRMLEIGYAQKIQEVRDKFGFTNIECEP